MAPSTTDRLSPNERHPRHHTLKLLPFLAYLSAIQTRGLGALVSKACPPLTHQGFFTNATAGDRGSRVVILALKALIRALWFLRAILGLRSNQKQLTPLLQYYMSRHVQLP